MEVAVLVSEPDSIVLQAPLDANLNHRGTAFGGSVSTLAILAGWAHVHMRLRAEGLHIETVIQKSAVEFEAPICDALRATSEPVDAADWARFRRSLARRGKGRIYVAVRVESAGRVAARFRGAYVAVTVESG